MSNAFVRFKEMKTIIFSNSTHIPKWQSIKTEQYINLRCFKQEQLSDLNTFSPCLTLYVAKRHLQGLATPLDDNWIASPGDC